MINWQVKIKVLIFLLTLLIISNHSLTASDKIVIGGMNGLNPEKSETQHSVLLALSGGGARGLSVIGILKAFEEKNIRIDAIAGTSMGGIVGGLYAVGYNPDQLVTITANISFDLLFSNSPPRRSMFLTQRQKRDRHLISIRFNNFKPIIPQGFTAGQQLTSLLTDLTTKANYQCAADFTNLPIPFKTISTDIVSGQQVVLDKGSIADAMRSTMAFPLAFTGVEYEDQILMDGGMVMPIPVDLVRTLSDSIKFVVAINTSSKLSPKDQLNSPVVIANQVTTIMTSDKLKMALEKADYIIEPSIDNIRATDFHKRDSLVELGYRLGLEAADKIITALESKKQKKLLEINSISCNNGIDSTVFSSFVNKKLTREELIKQLKNISLEHNYFELEVLLTQHENNRDTTFVNLILNGFKNFHVSEINLQFHGNKIFDDLTLANQMFTENSLVTPSSLEIGLNKITELYDEQGYDLVYIKNVDIRPSQNKIVIDIDEAVVQKIDIENNTRTKDWFVRSYFPIKAGEPYSTKLATEGIRNIYGTNLFDRVTVQAIPSSSGVIAVIKVEEKTYSQFRMGWHWDDEYESEEFIEYLDDNVAGIGLEYLIHARYSPARQQYYLSLKTDRIFSTYLTSRMLLYYNRLDRKMYSVDEEEVGIRDEVKSGFNIQLGQQIARLGMVSADFIIEEVEYTDSLKSGVKEYQEFGLRIISLKSTVESFNKVPFPESGNKHLFQIQFAGKYLGGEVEFTKVFTSHEMYIPLGKYVNYHPHIAVGVSRSGLPPTEQFYLGGIRSFIGFRTYQLAGDKMFQFSNEIRYKLPYRFYFSFNFDFGEVYNHTDQIKLRNLRHGFGVALALDAPIGPIEIGYGIADKDFKNLYINVGLKF